jgi:acyl carrier protein phosphodiesterase
MAEPMTLREDDVGRIGDYVKPWLRELVEEMVPRQELGSAGAPLLERMVRVEEELKAQRTLMDERFGFMARRFENMLEYMNTRFEGVETRFQAIDTRFDAVDTRFDAVDRRFDAVDTRFEDMNARFTTLTWMIGVGFVVVTSLTTLFALLS